MAYRPKRRFIRVTIELPGDRYIHRKVWTYGHTERALLNASRTMQAEYPEWRSIETHWYDDLYGPTLHHLKGAARC